MVFFGISVFQCFGMSVLFACSFHFVRVVTRFVCFYFVVFCFASFCFLFALFADATNLYVLLFVSLHFVCLASFRFVLLRFALFASLLLLFFCVLFVSVRSFVSVFSLFSGDGFHFYGFGPRHQSRCPCLCLGVVVRFVLFHLLFVCVFRACSF